VDAVDRAGTFCTVGSRVVDPARQLILNVTFDAPCNGHLRTMPVSPTVEAEMAVQSHVCVRLVEIDRFGFLRRARNPTFFGFAAGAASMRRSM